MREVKRSIIVSPLNWGLGHASRCIPIVRALIEDDFEPVLAGDGDSLELLTVEFPSLRTYELPAYDIRYSTEPAFFKLKLLSQGLSINKTISAEYERIQEIVTRERPAGIISDNRFGVRSNQAPSVYLTHQLQIKAGLMSAMATRWHQRVISRFDACWVCDSKGAESLAGDLSSDPGTLKKVRWIGPLSRFSHVESPLKDIDVAVVLSGPEPARSLFQERVTAELKGMEQSVVLVEGLLAPKQNHRKEENLTVYNYMLTEELETLINRSRLVVSRSGYSSIMDLHVLGAKVLFVPTPGQTEQEYLANYLEEKGICPYVSQNSFTLEALQKVDVYAGFKTKKTSKSASLSTLFDVFK